MPVELECYHGISHHFDKLNQIIFFILNDLINYLSLAVICMHDDDHSDGHIYCLDYD